MTAASDLRNSACLLLSQLGMVDSTHNVDLVAAVLVAERERCAVRCDDETRWYPVGDIAHDAVRGCAQAIRDQLP
jgi:hypothetical protein